MKKFLKDTAQEALNALIGFWMPVIILWRYFKCEVSSQECKTISAERPRILI